MAMTSRWRVVATILVIITCNIASNLYLHYKTELSSESIDGSEDTTTRVSHSERSLLSLRGIDGSAQESQCRFYLAESALFRAGLGVFTSIDIPKGGETGPMPDICVYVANTPQKTEIDSHSWQDWKFHGAFDGKNPRAVCEGVTTLYNSVGNIFTSTAETSENFIHSNGGLQRNKHPGAGSITHYFGIVSKARRNIEAGSEITIGGLGDEGEPSFEKIERHAPNRSPDWLRKHGMCMDNIRIQTATDPAMGRGAFAAYDLKKGTLVAPMPLQSFKRSVFQNTQPEELIINYSFQLKGTDILLFPYGQGVGLINHSHKTPNVALRWSTSNMNHAQWLDLSLDEYWKVTYQGGLILEVFALQDIAKGDELFLDYGKDWEIAWTKHQRSWSPIEGAQSYTYPADMDRSLPFPTVKEQKSNPYPTNLMTVCNTANFKRKRNTIVKWKKARYNGFRRVYPCNILKRTKKVTGYEYLVSLNFDKKNPSFDPLNPYIDTHVPHDAISWVDKPYMSDTYLPNAFRHPIGLPDHLIPKQWI